MSQMTDTNHKTPKESKSKQKKKNVSSDDDSDSEWVPDLEHDDAKQLEIQTLMQQMFPSAWGKTRLNALTQIHNRKCKQSAINKLKNICYTKDTSSEERSYDTGEDEDEDWEEGDEEGDEECEEGDEECEEEGDEESIDESDDEKEDGILGKNVKFNIVLTVDDDGNLYNDEEEDEDEYDSESESGCYPMFKIGDIVDAKESHWDDSYRGEITNVLDDDKYNIKLHDTTLEEQTWDDLSAKNLKLVRRKDAEKGYVEALEELTQLVKLKKTKGSKGMLDRLEELSMAAEEKDKETEKANENKKRKKNLGKFKKLLRNKVESNDSKFFKGLTFESQDKLILELKEINRHNNIDKPYRISLLDADIPLQYKAEAMKKINILDKMDPGSGEYYKIKQWVDGFMGIPFGSYNSIPVSLSDGKEMCGDFMENAMNKLNSVVYGLTEAKMQILQYLGQLIANPDSVGSAIGIGGPPGTGKTSMLRALSEILERPFTLIAAGGASDGSVFEGHSYTYEGSKAGKIVESLIQLKTMSPIFGIDELDKLSNTPRGEEVSGIFTHAIDTTFNDKFEDKYYSSIKIDLSRALWVFTYNDESKINPILADRMYKINTGGYSTKEKLHIASDYLIPKIEQGINFAKGEIVFGDEVLTTIIEKYTDGEQGVRNLKRCLEIIYTKINLFKLMKTDSKIFGDEKIIKVTTGMEITVDLIGKLLKSKTKSKTPFGLYL